MTHTSPKTYTELFALPQYVEQFWELGWLAALGFWNELLTPFCPARDDHPIADPTGQLVIPEPLAEDHEHGLLA